jgi:hypothetical protein
MGKIDDRADFNLGIFQCLFAHLHRTWFDAKGGVDRQIQAQNYVYG